MKRFTKIAVRIPSATLKALERVRQKQGRSRSAAVTEAIEHWLAAQELGRADRRYVEGYLRRPERTAGFAAIARTATQTWEPWLALS